ncbi:MAG: hypothetical protein HYS26_02110 [Candidatus Kaiserbacteria bacterium]|nr:MAG: hypothetical protein HYS26_02110 [Candidatus Kaiserbacteria bacterium]
MTAKLWIAIGVLFLVVILGAILIALPAPAEAPVQGTAFVSENVRVDAPRMGETVASTIEVRGQARGNWYFEASFPLEVRDPSGKRVGEGYAMTSEEWMTTNFVSFEGTVVATDYRGPATLVLHKDNPSGLPENDDSVEFSIVIK